MAPKLTSSPTSHDHSRSGAASIITRSNPDDYASHRCGMHDYTQNVVAATEALCGELGDVEIGWRILEPHDGAVVQMVIPGDQTTRVQFSGTLESARSPRIVRPASALQDNGREQLWSTAGTSQGRNAVIAVGVVSGIVAFSICSRLSKSWRRLVAERRFIQLGLVVCVGVVGIAIARLTIFALGIDYTTTYRVPSSLMSQADSQ